MKFTDIFKRGSTTYFYASVFFPESIKQDVFTLYAFVRTADDFVDVIPQQKKAFETFVHNYHQAVAGKSIQDPILTSFVALQKKYTFSQAWVDAFLQAMAADLTKKTYMTLAETEKYMYGSAEVVGLMMAKIMHLPEASFPAAQKLGRAMQYINFIRDILEDDIMGRLYLPKHDLNKHHLSDLSQETAEKNPDAFIHFIHEQLSYYENWQREAEAGFHYIPKRFLIPIKTASDMYNWTAEQIKKHPFVVYEKKVKPTKRRILLQAIKNSL